MQETVKQYQEQGYTLVPRVFTREEIAQLRAEAMRIFDEVPRDPNFDSPNVKVLAVDRFPALRKIFENGKLKEIVEAIGGKDARLLPNSGLHDSCLFGCWHRDTETSDYVNNRHREPDYHFFKIGIYLQDNDPEYAGGLDVVPGSHKTDASYWTNLTNGNRRLKWVLSHLVKRGLAPRWVVYGRRPNAYQIPSKAGDVVCFNFHTDHRSSEPKKTSKDPGHRKLALFVSFAPVNRHSEIYLSILKKQGMKAYTYAPEYVADMAKYGIRLYPMPEPVESAAPGAAQSLA